MAKPSDPPSCWVPEWATHLGSMLLWFLFTRFSIRDLLLPWCAVYCACFPFLQSKSFHVTASSDSTVLALLSCGWRMRSLRNFTPDNHDIRAFCRNNFWSVTDQKMLWQNPAACWCAPRFVAKFAPGVLQTNPDNAGVDIRQGSPAMRRRWSCCSAISKETFM